MCYVLVEPLFTSPEAIPREQLIPVWIVVASGRDLCHVYLLTGLRRVQKMIVILYNLKIKFANIILTVQAPAPAWIDITADNQLLSCNAPIKVLPQTLQ